MGRIASGRHGGTQIADEDARLLLMLDACH